MKGSHYLKIDTPRIKYTFEFDRKVNILLDESGRGKTTIINLINKTINKSKNVRTISSLQPTVLQHRQYEEFIRNEAGNLFIIDEYNYINNKEFSRLIRNSDNYFLIITRESIPAIPYSVNSIFEIKTIRDKYIINKVLPKKYHIELNIDKLDTIITEDSGSRFQFFSKVKDKVFTTNGNSKILEFLRLNPNLSNSLFIMDGSAFGPYIDNVYNIITNMDNVGIICPESFEYVILQSNIFKSRSVMEIVNNPENFIDISEHLTWETYFYELLRLTIQDTLQKNIHLQKSMIYRKDKIGDWFIQEPQFSKIVDTFYSNYIINDNSRFIWK